MAGSTLQDPVDPITLCEPTDANSNLELSGRVITVMNLLPYELYTDPPTSLPTNSTSALPPSPPPDPALSARSSSRANSTDLPMYIRQRRGNSALYSAQWFLSSGTKWETILVAWTGVIANLESDDFSLNERETQAAETLLAEMASEDDGPKMVPIWLHRGHQSRWQAYAEQSMYISLLQFQPSVLYSKTF